MNAAPQNFRKAFHGFNKDDVVQYLEYINTKHNNHIQQLTEELEELRSQQPVQQQELVETLQAQCAELTEKLEAAEAELEILRAQQAEIPEVPVSQPEAPAPAPTSELEIYRRAERAEQEARDRAELIYYQANSVLTEASGKVDAASAEITQLADQILAQLTKMQMLVSSSKQVLQETSSMLNIIRPNK